MRVRGAGLTVLAAVSLWSVSLWLVPGPGFAAAPTPSGTGCAEECPPSSTGLLIGALLLAFVLGAVPLTRMLIRRRGSHGDDTQVSSWPPGVRRAAVDLFRDVHRAWTSGDEAGMGELVAPALLMDWLPGLAAARSGRSLRTRIHGPVRMEYLGSTRAPDTGEQIVTVRVQARLAPTRRTREKSALDRRAVGWWC